jgi:hypothetical protein
VALALLPGQPAGAATGTATVTFAGTITGTMKVNNGTNTGMIPAGTAYTGTLTYAADQAPAPAAYGGGSKTVYAFDNLAFTIGASTANSGPGRIVVHDNLLNAQGYPNGDSIYVNFAGVAPSGLLAGAAFNWMGLALLDPTGAAVSGGVLPANLDIAKFPTRFSEFNFGTLGTPWGAGNTSMIQGLSSLSTSGGVVTPPPITFAPSLPDGTVGVAYSASFAGASGGTPPFTYSAAGLPAGLSLSGTTVSGTPSVAGDYTVNLTATDAANQSSTAPVPLRIGVPPLVITTASLPGGTVGVPYQAPISVSGGLAPYSVNVSGLPAGLNFDGASIAGIPAVSGSFTVNVSATDSLSTSVSKALSLTIAAGGNYTVVDESKGKITAIGPNFSYLMVGTKKLIWDASTYIIVNTPNGERHVIDGFVTVGMRVQWKGLRDRATNTVLTSQIEIN